MDKEQIDKIATAIISRVYLSHTNDEDNPYWINDDEAKSLLIDIISESIAKQKQQEDDAYFKVEFADPLIAWNEFKAEQEQLKKYGSNILSGYYDNDTAVVQQPEKYFTSTDIPIGGVSKKYFGVTECNQNEPD